MTKEEQDKALADLAIRQKAMEFACYFPNRSEDETIQLAGRIYGFLKEGMPKENTTEKKIEE